MKKLFVLFLALTFLLSGCVNFPQSTAEKGIDLYGMYDTNDLLISEKVETYKGTKVNIPQLNGLKNTEVQNKINNDIYVLSTNLIQKYDTINYANFYTYANFANVISISFNVGFDAEPYFETAYFNYNLVDGTSLKLEDLFVKDTDILEIVRSAFYSSMALHGSYDKDTYIHSPDEYEVYKAVKSYMNSKEKPFAFTPSEICFYSGDIMSEVKMIDIYDKVCIYSKFLTKESIFTGEYEGYKNIFTCADTQYDLFDIIEYGYIEDNLWYDFTVSESYIPFEDPPTDERQKKFEAFRQQAIEKERAKIDSARKTAKANPDKFYILLLKPYIQMEVDSQYDKGEWHYTYQDTATVNTQSQLYEMPLELYESTYRDKIIETYRYEYFAMRGGAYFDPENLDGAILQETNDAYTENYMEI